MSAVSPEFYWLSVAVVTVLSSARLTRFLTHDDFPPIKWARERYQEWTDHGWKQGWQIVSYCGYCMSFWMTLLVVLTGVWAGVLGGEAGAPAHQVWGPVWWLANGVLGGSYVAAIVMALDQDDSKDDDSKDDD